MLQFSSQTRAELAVAIARIGVSASVGLIGTGAELPAGQANAIHLAFGAYSIVAIALLFVTLGRELLSHRLVRWTHLLDMGMFSALLLVHSIVTLPMLIILLFPLASAAVRFSARGFIVSAICSLAVFGLAGWIAASNGVPQGPIIFRALILLVVCGLMAHLRLAEEELREHLIKLALWKQKASEELPVRQILEHVNDVFPARLILAWEESDEPWLHLAWRQGQEFRWVRESPTKFEPVLAPELEDCTFLCRDIEGQETRLYALDAGRVSEKRLRPLHPALISRFSIRRVLGVPVQGATFEGVLLILDNPRMRLEDMYIGKLLGEFIANRLDLHYLLEREAESAVSEERIRLSRDLHDGVLQSLTGASLQIEAVRRLVDVDPERAVERLGEIQQILASDQRELRAFIRHLRPSASKHASDVRLRTRLSDLKNRFRRQWGLEVEIDTSGLGLTVLHGLRNEIYSVINEAVANAAKHAAASRVSIEVTSERDQVRIIVVDDGKGFPFKGRYSLEELDRDRLGPVTLKERIASLGGGLVLDSTDEGSRLEISVPLDWSEGSWLSAS